jgi:ssDNA-binding Zn-finger/Zn-ribbon topoisomerase 1
MYGCSGANIKKVSLKIGIELEQRRLVNESEKFGKGIIKVPKGKCKNCGKEFPMYASKLNIYCSNKCQQEHQHN